MGSRISHILERVCGILYAPLGYTLYFLSGLLRRDDHLWAFGSSAGGRFADNPKWLYLWMSSHGSNSIRPVWLTDNESVVEEIRSMGLEAHKKRSLVGAMVALKAGVYVFDTYSTDISFWLSRKARKVNLWHGSPLKRIERDITQRHSSYYAAHHGTPLQRRLFRFFRPFMFERYEAMICSSPYTQKILASAFAMEEDRIWLTGYPRNDVVRGSSYTRRFISDQYWFRLISARREPSTKVILYLPTFRDTQTNAAGLYKGIVEGLANGLPEHIVVFKPHMNEPFSGINSEGNLVLLPAHTDLYPILSIADILITDYSSVYFDFLMTERPVLFFPFDYADYLRGSREFYVDYSQETPGPKSDTLADIVRAVREAEWIVAPSHRDNYARIRAKYNYHVDGRASQRVYNLIIRMIQGAS